ncbi:MAG: hypothetical protein K2L38_06410, partial [Dysosmobacter sp.]|nr:hypothetical protein [Dysosmobacter sp.]
CSLSERDAVRYAEQFASPSLTGPAASARPEGLMLPITSSTDFMELIAIQCVDQMVQDIQDKLTPEELEQLAAEMRQAEEQQGNSIPPQMGPAM